jgi:MFS transporter, DHA1 family, multidrug resistance protein
MKAQTRTIGIFTALCISTCAVMLGVGILMPIMPLYAMNLGASGTMVGIVMASFALTMAISNPIVGRLADKYGYKQFIVIGLIFNIPVALAYIFAKNASHLIAIRLIEGVLAAMVESVAYAYAGSIAPKDREGSYMAIFNTFMMMGFGIGPIMGGFLMDRIDMKAPFIAMAAFIFLSLILVIILVPGDTKNKEQVQKENINKTGTPLKDAMASDVLKGLLVYALIVSIGQSGLFAFLPVVTKNQGLSASQIGLLSSVIMITAGVLQTPCGFLANRYNKLWLLMSGIFLIAAILAFVPICTNFWQFFILCIIGGTGSAISNPAGNAILVRGTKDMGLGFSMGLFNLSFGMGMIIGPVQAGIVMDMISLDMVFYISAALFVLSALVIYLYLRKVSSL